MRQYQQYRKRVPDGVKFIFVILFILAVLFLIGHVIVFLWNEILVDVTGVKPIHFWQAVGLFVLSRILFGGFRMNRGGFKKRMRGRWKERWSRMSDDERAEMKARWKERCGK